MHGSFLKVESDSRTASTSRSVLHLLPQQKGTVKLSVKDVFQTASDDSPIRGGPYGDNGHGDVFSVRCYVRFFLFLVSQSMVDMDILLLLFVNWVLTFSSFAFPPPDLTNDIVEYKKLYSATGSYDSDLYKGRCLNGVGMARTVMIAPSLVLLNSLFR